MTTYKIPDHYVLQFSKNMELLLQQKNSMLLETVNKGTYQSKLAQPVVQYGEVEMNEFVDGFAPGEWKGDTEWSEIEHHQRWVAPKDFAVSLPLSKQDLKRMLTDPQSSYAAAMRAGWARKVDEIIIAGATGPNVTGDQASPVINNLDPKNTISAGGEGLTIDKLIETQQRLLENHVDLTEGVYFMISPQQKSDLLRDEDKRLTSADYNTVRALTTGNVGSVMGFNFIMTYHLPGSGGIRDCMAWVKSGMHFGTWGSLEFEVDRRPDKNYVTQLWMAGTIGATRTQEDKFIKIECANDPLAI